jgi:REP element-mobilizing transposase RayT
VGAAHGKRDEINSKPRSGDSEATVAAAWLIRYSAIVVRGLSPPAKRWCRCAAKYGGTLMAGTYTKLFYHIVFSTKHRRPLITSEIESDLHKYIGGIIRGIDGSCIEINGIADHVHFLAILPPKNAVSDALREIKSNSSKWLHETKSDFGGFAWQDGFSAFSVSKSQVEPVQLYIRDQKNHHRQFNYQAELIGLLDKHGVEYDERYLWD